MEKKPQIIDIKNIVDERGQINFFEFEQEISFKIERVYYISQVLPNFDRGHHAHKKLQQLILAIGGIIEIELDDGLGNKNIFKLDSLNKALFVPAGYWRVLKFGSKEVVCMVFASQKYDENDYIRNYQEFLEYKKS